MQQTSRSTEKKEGKIDGAGDDAQPSAGSHFARGTSKVNKIVQGIFVPRFQREPDFSVWWFFFIYIHSKVHVLDALGLNKDKLRLCCQLHSRSRLAAPQVHSEEERW